MGYRFLGCPISFCSGFNISLLIEQPSLLLYNNGNFDPGSYEKKHPLHGFVCMHNFSKTCNVVVMNSKDTDPVYDASMECFKVMGHPQSICSDDEGSFNSKKLQNSFKDEGITHKITFTHANVAEKMIRTLQKMISDRLQVHTEGAWTIMLKPV